jgi:hypothetical protein
VLRVARNVYIRFGNSPRKIHVSLGWPTGCNDPAPRGLCTLSPEVTVDENLTFLIVMGAWVLLQAVILPAMGVPT